MLEEMGEDVSSLSAEIAEMTEKLRELTGGGGAAEGPPQYMYELFAVANHTGGTGGGHYCASTLTYTHSRSFCPFLLHAFLLALVRAFLCAA